MCNLAYASNIANNTPSRNFDIRMPVAPTEPIDPGNTFKTNTENNNVTVDTYSINATFASGTIINGTLFVRDKSFVIPATNMIDGRDFTANFADITSITILSWRPERTNKTGRYIFYPERIRVALNNGSEYVTTHTAPFHSFQMEANKRSFTIYSFFYADKRTGKWYIGNKEVSEPHSNPHEKTLTSISFRRGGGANFNPPDIFRLLMTQ